MLYKTITINHYENGVKTGSGIYRRVDLKKARDYFREGFTVWAVLNSGAYELKPYTVSDPVGDLAKTLESLRYWGSLRGAEYYAIVDSEKVEKPYWIR